MIGGLFQSDEIQFKYLPHKISPQDATLLLNFFDVIALGKYDMYLKMYINHTFPEAPKLEQHMLPTFLQ